MTLHLCRFVVVTLVTLCAHAWSVPAAIARPSAVPPLVELVPQFKKYEECRAAADAGDAAAMLELAWRYENGRDVRRNVDDARAWLNKAVEVGHADAQFFLARNLAADTADFNLQRSATLLRAAADQGHVEAAYTYATVRLDGRGVAGHRSGRGHRLPVPSLGRTRAQGRLAAIPTYRAAAG